LTKGGGNQEMGRGQQKKKRRYSTAWKKRKGGARLAVQKQGKRAAGQLVKVTWSCGEKEGETVIRLK